MILMIRSGGLDDPQVLAMLKFHFDTNINVTPPGSAHVLDVSRLKADDVSFWSAWDGDRLMGVGALKRMTADHGEIKSMHSRQDVRRSGIGSAMLLHIMAEAKAAGLTRLSLETGSFDFFKPAVALYRKHGFVECENFGDYKPDPYSTFMSREI